MRFLVVDDSPTMRRIVINALKAFGYTEVIEAGDGQEGFDKLTSGEVIDFVITD
jgi:two-component system chemotaxis response regulator CheY